MSDLSKPIPTRFETGEMDLIEQLSERTGISKSEIIRRAVSRTLQEAAAKKNLDFLLGNPEEIASLLDEITGADLEGGFDEM